LASNPYKYEEYCQQVRQEFIMFPDEIFIPGRINFIRNMLEKKNIFLTKKFIQLFDKQAVINLYNELNHLSDKLGLK